MACDSLDGNTFGAYLPVEVNKSNSGFIGNGETFLFNFQVSINHASLLFRMAKSGPTDGVRRTITLFTQTLMESQSDAMKITDFSFQAISTMATATHVKHSTVRCSQK